MADWERDSTARLIVVMWRDRERITKVLLANGKEMVGTVGWEFRLMGVWWDSERPLVRYPEFDIHSPEDDVLTAWLKDSFTRAHR